MVMFRTGRIQPPSATAVKLLDTLLVLYQGYFLSTKSFLAVILMFHVLVLYLYKTVDI